LLLLAQTRFAPLEEVKNLQLDAAALTAASIRVFKRAAVT